MMLVCLLENAKQCCDATEIYCIYGRPYAKSKKTQLSLDKYVSMFTKLPEIGDIYVLWNPERYFNTMIKLINFHNDVQDGEKQNQRNCTTTAISL